MGLNDILLHIDSYPEPTSTEAIDQAVAFAAAVGGQLTALALQIKIPVRSNRLADYLIHLSELAEGEEAKSLGQCRAALEHFTARARDAGVFRGALLEQADLNLMSDAVAERARTRDLCLIPIGGSLDGQQDVAQTVIFGAGRPALLFDSQARGLPAKPLGVVVLAWDGSRCAARAMADAMPLLTQAAEVRVLTVTGDKPGAVSNIGLEPVRHLKTHGVAALADEVEADHAPTGQVLTTYLKAHKADLLVMGAFVHSRLREMVMGGATAEMLRASPVPVLMSH